MTLLRFGFAAALLLPLAGCESLIQIDDGGGGSGGNSECGPRPKSDSWCPPIYECIDGEWVVDGSAGACPEPACPTSQPQTGDPCQKIGQKCSYWLDEPCGEGTSEYVSTCTETGWMTAYNICQPEPTCPKEMPLEGSDCSGWEYPYFCQYDVACLDTITPVSMSCDYGTDPPAWRVDSPAVCPGCEIIGDASSCLATTGCQWLVPGCGEGLQVTEGCYPMTDCLQDGCSGGDVCTPYEHNPCWNALCDSCSAPIGFCQSPPPNPD